MESRRESTPSTSHARILRKRRVPLQSTNHERENKIIKLDQQTIKPTDKTLRSFDSRSRSDEEVQRILPSKRASEKSTSQILDGPASPDPIPTSPITTKNPIIIPNNPSKNAPINYQEKVCWEIFNMKTPEKFQPMAPDTPATPQSPLVNRRFIRKYNPLPLLNWTDSYETWFSMVSRETEAAYFREENPYKHNPDLQPKMRAILIDWLIEVCDVYKLQRKTLYMAIDYVDRYLSRSRNIQKTSLQLIGITSLFIAAKNEEIYPPKLHEFCFITDGACTTDEMLAFELHMLQVLRWKLSPITPICWLGVFMQIHATRPTDEFLVANYDQNLFIRTSQLLDLCIMSSESIQFRYHLLAATALSFFIRSIITVTQITALSCDEMQECRTWMLPYFKILDKEDNRSLVCPTDIPNVPSELVHNIQTRHVNLGLLEKVETLRDQTKVNPRSQLNSSSATLSTPQQPSKPTCGTSRLTDNQVQVLTPPKSTELKQKLSQTVVSVDPNTLAVKQINLHSN